MTISLGCSFNSSFISNNSPQSPHTPISQSSFTSQTTISSLSSNASISRNLTEDEISKKIQDRLKKLKERVNGNRKNVDLVKRSKQRLTSPKRVEDTNILSNAITATDKARLIKEDHRVEKLQKREQREFFNQSEKRAKSSFQKLQQLSELSGNNQEILNAKQELMNQIRCWEQRFDNRQFSPRRQREIEMREKGSYRNVESRFTSPPKSPRNKLEEEYTFSPRVNTATNEKLNIKSRFKSPVHSSTSTKDIKKLLEADLTFKPKINEQSKKKKSKVWDYLEKSKNENEEKQPMEISMKREKTPIRKTRPKNVRVALSPSQSRVQEARYPRNARSNSAKARPNGRKITPKRTLSAKKIRTPNSLRSNLLSNVQSNTATNEKSPRRVTCSTTIPKSNGLKKSSNIEPPRKSAPSKQLSPRRGMSPQKTKPVSSPKHTEILTLDHVPLAPVIVGTNDQKGASYTPQTIERVEKMKQSIERSYKFTSMHKSGGFIDIENEY